MSLDSGLRYEDTIVVGLVADPDLSTTIANRVAGELPSVLSRLVSDQVVWKVCVSSETIPLDETGHIPLVGYARARIPWEEWDLMVVLTDLPRRVDGHPVIGDFSKAYCAARISLPASGWARVGANVRDTIVYFVDQITRGWTIRQRRAEDDGQGGLMRWSTRGPSAVRSVPSTQEGIDAYLALAGIGGKARLLFGTVRNNRPWRLVAGLSSATAAAGAGAALGIFFSNIWSLADASPAWRLALISVLTVVVMVGWLILYNGL